MNYSDYKEAKKNEKEQNDALAKEMKVYANRFFSSEEGKKYGRQLLKAVKYFEPLPANVGIDYLRYMQAQRDLVNVFVVGLIDNKTLINLIKDE